MSKEEQKPDNQAKAMGRIQSIMDKYRIIKAPVLINNVMEYTFGDLKDDEKKADRAFKLVSSLVNQLVDSGSLESYVFVSSSIPPGQSTPSIVQEQMLVLPSFQLVGWQRTSFMEEDQGSVQQSATADDSIDKSIYDVIGAESISQLIADNATQFAIVDGQGQTTLRPTAQSASGKFLEVSANDSATTLYAMIPIEATVSFSLLETEPTEMGG